MYMSKKLFDFAIGNPPYDERTDTYNRQEPVYPHFYDATETIADKYLLISPARFLFNAGLTSKAWNQKMLNDSHLVVEKYYHDSAEVFSNTNINGGIAIIYRDSERTGKPIKNFIPNETLRKIASHFDNDPENNMTSIIYGGRSDLKFNETFLSAFPFTKEHILKQLQKKHPEITELGPNEEYEIKSSSFERTDYAFESTEPEHLNEYYCILGVEKGNRVYKWIRREYLTPRYPNNNNIEGYKVMISNADGAAGQIGKPKPARIIGKPVIAKPGTSSVPTFMSIGNFESETEALSLEKYIKTKFVRVLLGILKITQHITPGTWAYVPLQDFTSNSDINWNASIKNIDKQLYKKYGLSDEEINFIETNVKEME